MTPVIEARGLSKRFRVRSPTPVQALSGIDLTLQPETIFALLGPNGSGKTTLLKILAGLLLPDEGEIRIHGSPVNGDGLWRQRQVALASSSGRDFYSRLTVRQNLEFFAVLYDLPPKEIRPSVEQTAQRLGLAEVLDRPYEQLSGGTRQKLILARALLGRASILLLDEPTRGLDPIAARKFRSFLKESVKKFKKTLLLTTHNLAEAAEMADLAGILHEGRLVKVGEAAKVAAAFESLCRDTARSCP